MGYQFDWSVLVTFRHLLWHGLTLTVELSVAAMAASLVLGSLVGIGRSAELRWLRPLLAAYVEFFRNIPLIVQFFFWYFAVGLDTWPAAFLGLTVYTSAYIGEVIRAGIQSVPLPQVEAARSFGMTFAQAMRYVIFPQAFLRIVPALAIEFINVVKNSSIAMTIGLAELTFQTQQIESQTFRGFEAATAITVLYVVLAFAIVLAMSRLERALRLQVRIG
jgi:polar amino acid transport system permease protein